jgi:zinc-ribbon domain
MKCPNCGNELDPNEVFCGQCGAPTRPTGLPTEMVQTPPARSGQLNNPYSTQVAPGTGTYNAGPPSPSYQVGALPPNANQSTIRPSGPQQQSEFYGDATEAMSIMPNNTPGYSTGYPQHGYTGMSAQGGAPVAGQYGQSVQAGNYAPPNFPQAPIYQTGQAYGSRPGMTPPPKRNNNVVMVIAIICLACAIIAVSAFGILYLVHKNNTKTAFTPTPTVTATTAPSPSPTPSLTPSPTVTPSPTQTVTPSPTVTPDTGFSFCDTPCTTNGFQVESPNGWLQTTPDATTVKFDNPAQIDVYAIFRTPGATSANATTLINTDLTNNYASNPGYTAPTSTSSATISGESWTSAIATYQLNGATERIEVYATVHQGKAYMIEQQAPDAQFDTVNTSNFQIMLNRFQFQTV